MNCKCGKELVGRQKFCSDRCRKAESRTKSLPALEQTRTEIEVKSDISPKSDKLGQVAEFLKDKGVDGVPVLTDGDMSHKVLRQLDKVHGDYPDRVATYEDYCALPDDYASRSKPDKLNWGKPMSASEMSAAGFVANRVTLPGDWDYKGKFN